MKLFWHLRPGFKDTPVNLVKLDLSKLFELQVLVVESEQELLHLIKQMLLGLGIRKINCARSLEELFENNEKLPYDIILLDYAIDDSMNGAEIVEEMISAGILPNRTRLILMAAQNDRAQYAIEYPYHQVEYLARPFNKQHLDLQLKQHVMYGQFLKPILALAGLRRFSDALKILLHTQQQKLPPGLAQHLQKLKVQLLLDLGKFELVLPLLKTALAEQQGWALWALFRIRYERGDLAGCEAFLQDGSEELAKYAERREVWQLYLALQQQDYAKACQISAKIPNVGMSMKMVRLVHLVMVLAGKIDAALEFIERKRRLAVQGKLFIQLSVAQARSLLYLLTSADAKQQTQLNAQLQQLQHSIEADPASRYFQAELLLLKVHQYHLSGQCQAANSLLIAQQQLLEPAGKTVSLLCHAAVVFASLGLMHTAFDYLFYANQCFDQMSDNSSRVFAGCLHRQTFDFIIASEQRATCYAEMAKRHQQLQEWRLAAKMYHAAWRLSSADAATAEHYLQQLYPLMQQLAVPQFRGVPLPAPFVQQASAQSAVNNTSS